MPTQAEFLRAPLDTGSPLRLPSDLQQVCSFLDVAYTCRSSPGIVSALMIGLAMTGMSLECHTLADRFSSAYNIAMADVLMTCVMVTPPRRYWPGCCRGGFLINFRLVVDIFNHVIVTASRGR